jgi:hypothetical protein
MDGRSAPAASFHFALETHWEVEFCFLVFVCNRAVYWPAQKAIGRLLSPTHTIPSDVVPHTHTGVRTPDAFAHTVPTPAGFPMTPRGGKAPPAHLHMERMPHGATLPLEERRYMEEELRHEQMRQMRDAAGLPKHPVSNGWVRDSIAARKLAALLLIWAPAHRSAGIISCLLVCLLLSVFLQLARRRSGTHGCLHCKLQRQSGHAAHRYVRTHLKYITRHGDR